MHRNVGCDLGPVRSFRQLSEGRSRWRTVRGGERRRNLKGLLGRPFDLRLLLKLKQGVAAVM